MRHCAIPLGSKSDQSGFIYLFSIKQTWRSNNIIKHLATFIKWVFFIIHLLFCYARHTVYPKCIYAILCFLWLFFLRWSWFYLLSWTVHSFFSSKTLPKSQSAFSMQTLYHTPVNMYISTPNYLFIFEFYLLFMSSKWILLTFRRAINWQ